MNTEQCLFAMIGNTVCGRELSEDLLKPMDDAQLEALYTLSKKHDMAHVVAQGLEGCGALGAGACSAKFQKQRMVAVYRCNQIQYELARICETLEENEIVYLPLKGSVLRNYYPEAWMRTSCDIDVLVKKNELERAADVLVRDLNYTRGDKNFHDISLYSPSGVHLELHFDLIEEMRHPAFADVLSRVWEESRPKEGCRFGLQMGNAFFYVYHVAHMAKHFEEGGCGIRPFLDLWMLNRLENADMLQREAWLREMHLTTFHEAVRKLSEVWFSDEAHDELTLALEQFILYGGVYGNLDNKVSVQQHKKGGRVQFVFRKIFPTYQRLSLQYPILKKHPWLTPVWTVKRWFQWAFGGRTSQTMREIRANHTVSQDKLDRTAELYSKLGLDK